MTELLQQNISSHITISNDERNRFCNLFVHKLLKKKSFLLQEGETCKFEGREALYAYLKDYPSYIDVKSLPTLKIYGTTDANVAIAEWSASGMVIGNGNPYEMSYATFVTFRDGLIVNYREYWNPQAFQKAMSGGSFAE